MIAAQLLATHYAAMECYRRAMISEQTAEDRRENLSQANEFSRAYATLLEALNCHRGNGQPKVTVERVHGHAGGQAVVDVIEPPWGVIVQNQKINPMQSKLLMHRGRHISENPQNTAGGELGATKDNSRFRSTSVNCRQCNATARPERVR